MLSLLASQHIKFEFAYLLIIACCYKSNIFTYEYFLQVLLKGSRVALGLCWHTPRGTTPLAPISCGRADPARLRHVIHSSGIPHVGIQARVGRCGVRDLMGLKLQVLSNYSSYSSTILVSFLFFPTPQFVEWEFLSDCAIS